MPDFTITISDAHVARIQAATAAYNEEHGTALTAKQWVILVLKRTVLASELQDSATNLALQKDAELRAAIPAAEQGLLDTI